VLTTTVIIVLAVLAVAGFGVSAWLTLRSKFDGTKVDNARERAETIVTQAEEEQRKARTPVLPTGRATGAED